VTPATEDGHAARGRDERGVTLAGYYETWLRDHPVGAHTKECYLGILRAALLPELGDTALADIDVPTVKDFLRKMEEAGCTNASVAKTKTVLSALMQTASETPDIPVAFNPVRGVRIGGTRPNGAPPSARLSSPSCSPSCPSTIVCWPAPSRPPRFARRRPRASGTTTSW